MVQAINALQLCYVRYSQWVLSSIFLVGDLHDLWGDDDNNAEHKPSTLEDTSQFMAHIFKKAATTALNWLHTQQEPKCQYKQCHHNNQQKHWEGLFTMGAICGPFDTDSDIIGVDN